MKRREFLLSAAIVAAAGTSLLYLERQNVKTDDYAQDVPKDKFKNAVINASCQDGGQLVIFEAGASWCPACKIIAPTLNALVSTANYENKPVIWIRTDIGTWESSVDFIEEWGIKGIPHLGAFYKGQEVPNSIFEKVPSKSELAGWLEKVKRSIKDVPTRPSSSPSNLVQDNSRIVLV